MNATAPPRPTVVAGNDDQRARLNRLLDLAAGHLGNDGAALLTGIDRVSVAYHRLKCHWLQSPSALQRAAVDLACVQERLDGCDHLVAVRPAGGA